MSYVTGLAVAVFVLLVITYGFFSYDFFTSVNESLEGELDALELQYGNKGALGLEQFVEERAQKNQFSRFTYILVDKNHQKVSGALSHWPNYKEWSDGWLSFEMGFKAYNNEEKVFNFLARSRHLDDDHILLVARVADDVRQSIQLVAGSLFWGMIIMILLGLLGGVITSLMTLHRVETINDSIKDIMRGNLKNRIPVVEPLDDFQQLAMSINDMLDRIESAMSDVRDVSNGIAHDLRTPLTRLRNNLSLLEKRSAPQNTDMVRDMLGEADNLLSTFSALLRISQVESGAKRANFADVNISQIVTDVVELYEPLSYEKNQTLSFTVAKDLVVFGDKDLLFQMLANLMDNAIKYTPENGSIRVSQSHIKGAKGNYLEVEFEDSGPGIPKEKQEHVFKRFYRVDESRGVSPGNGLGLALVYAVAKLHYGQVFLSNVSFYAKENKGLRVTVKLGLGSET